MNKISQMVCLLHFLQRNACKISLPLPGKLHPTHLILFGLIILKMPGEEYKLLAECMHL
jgi:hypothetical protein